MSILLKHESDLERARRWLQRPPSSSRASTSVAARQAPRPATSAYDTKQDQHRPMVEGIVNTEGTAAAGFYYDYGAIDEVAVQTKGHTAEMPWPGVWSNFIAKSGGNEYHGKIDADYQNKGIQAENIVDSATFLCPGGR